MCLTVSAPPTGLMNPVLGGHKTSTRRTMRSGRPAGAAAQRQSVNWPLRREAIGHAAGTEGQACFLIVLVGPADLAAGLGVRVVGLGGLEPPTSSLSVPGQPEVGGLDLAGVGSGGEPDELAVWRRCCHFCCQRPSGMNHRRARRTRLSCRQADQRQSVGRPILPLPRTPSMRHSACYVP
jgi:hypothetical protein